MMTRHGSQSRSMENWDWRRGCRRVTHYGAARQDAGERAAGGDYDFGVGRDRGGDRAEISADAGRVSGDGAEHDSGGGVRFGGRKKKRRRSPRPPPFQGHFLPYLPRTTVLDEK